jgi:hypothetical protein
MITRHEACGLCHAKRGCCVAGAPLHGSRHWSGCVEEAVFMEVELLDRLDTLISEDDNDLVLISGLVVFMVHCHVTLFDVKKVVTPAAARPTSKVDSINHKIVVVIDCVGADD